MSRSPVSILGKIGSARVLLLSLLVAGPASPSVYAQSVALTGGYLDMKSGGNFASGTLVLAGDRGFTSRMFVDSTGGFFGPVNSCVYCPAGTVVNLAANWLGNDLPGTVTLDGRTYTGVGGMNPTSPQMRVEFGGSVTLPPFAPSATVSARFTFTGGFEHVNEGSPANVIENLSGAGTVTLTLKPDPAFTDGWLIERIRYVFDSELPFPWISSDVGSVGLPGHAAFGNGSFFVSGAGGDIWGGEDGFHYAAQAVTSDSEIVARVTSVQNTNPFAKAGVMIRASYDRSAPYVVLNARPDGGIEFMTRQAAGGTTTFIAGASASLPAWLKLAREGSVIKAFVSSDGVAWSPIGSTMLAVPLAGREFTGLAVTSHDRSVLNQSIFDQVNVTAGSSAPPTALPAPWSQGDVGTVGQAGGASLLGGVFTVRGAGADIWGSADAFHYVYQPLHSDGTIVARVTSLQNTNPFAKAGVMVRAGLGADAAGALVNIRPNGAVEFLARSTTGGATSFVGGGMTVAFPATLMLQRVSAQVQSIIIASVFDDEAGKWMQIGSVTVTLPPAATTGLAVTSHDPKAVTAAQFDNVAVVRNLLQRGDFEEYTPPALGTPGWVSDDGLRQVQARSETNQPHTGAKNGACWTPGSGDCGMYQEVVATSTGGFRLTWFATADRGGGLVGANINGSNVGFVPVVARSFGNYGPMYGLEFQAKAGDVIRVWMFSPPTPGYVVLDDVALVQTLP